MTTEEYYDKFSDAYLAEYGPVFQSAVFSPNPKDFARVMMDRAIITPQHSVLDVGCGVGGVMSGLVGNGVEDVTGVTISKRQVELAELSLELADFMEWDDAGRNFDRIILCESFGYFPEPGRLIEKVRGLLNPGGMVYVKDVCAVSDPCYMQQYGLEAIGKLWGGYAVYSIEEMLWMWGMRRIGGGDNLWRETSCSEWVKFAIGESRFSRSHSELLAEAGRTQTPIWKNQMPIKAADFLFTK